MKAMKALGKPGIVFIIFFITLGAYVYVNLVPPVQPPISQPVQQPAEQEEIITEERPALAISVDTVNDVVRIENYTGAPTTPEVFVDGQKAEGVADPSSFTIALLDPLPAGEHVISVKAGGQPAEKRVLVEEKWTVSFDVRGSS